MIVTEVRKELERVINQELEVFVPQEKGGYRVAKSVKLKSIRKLNEQKKIVDDVILVIE